MSTRGPQAVTSGSNWVTTEHPTPRGVRRTYRNAGRFEAMSCWAGFMLKLAQFAPGGIHFRDPRGWSSTVARCIGHERRKESEEGCGARLLFSRSVVSDSLRPHELQQARLPCLSLSLCRFVLYNRQGVERCSRRETRFPRKRKGAHSSQETMDREMQGIQGSDIDTWQHLNRKHSYFWFPNIQSELEAGLFFTFC